MQPYSPRKVRQELIAIDDARFLDSCGPKNSICCVKYPPRSLCESYYYNHLNSYNSAENCYDYTDEIDHKTFLGQSPRIVSYCDIILERDSNNNSDYITNSASETANFPSNRWEDVYCKFFCKLFCCYK